jgi:hypothetical protein
LKIKLKMKEGKKSKKTAIICAGLEKDQGSPAAPEWLGCLEATAQNEPEYGTLQSMQAQGERERGGRDRFLF